MSKILQYASKINPVLISSLVVLGSQNASAVNERDFYIPKTGGVTKNLRTHYGVDNNFATDDSSQLQRAINDVSRAGGGRIIIPAGSYSFYEVLLKSNVRLEIDKGATIRPANNKPSGNYIVFQMGKKNMPRVENVSIEGMGGRFTVDLMHVTNRSVFVFGASNVNNFQIANFNIKDKKTEFQSVGLGPALNNDGTNPVPTNGVIKNADATTGEYGYGLVQIQAGHNILFKNLTGTGGVTLRVETGWGTMNKITPHHKRPTVDKIYGRNIGCKNGQGAVMLSPHTIDQGYVDIRGVESNACEFAVKTEKGHVDGTRYAGLSMTPGTFSNKSIISDVTAHYGDSAQVRSMYLRFIPCHLRNKIGMQDAVDKSYKSPAIAAVGNFAVGQFFGHSPSYRGSYDVKISNVRAYGFADGIQPILASDYEDYENCSGGPGVWIPKESRGTVGTSSITVKQNADNQASLGNNNSDDNNGNNGNNGNNNSGSDNSGSNGSILTGDQCNSTQQCKAHFGSSATDCKNSKSTTSVCMCGSVSCNSLVSSGDNNNSGNNKPSEPVAPSAGGIVHLVKSNAGGFAIDGNNGGANGQLIYLWSANINNVNQQWKEINRGNGYYSYQKANTNYCLDGGNGGANGRKVYLWTCQSGNQNQHWKKINAGGNSYRLEKRNAPAYSIDAGNGGANLQSVHLWKSNNNSGNQKWKITNK